MKKLTPNPPKTTTNPRWLSSSVTQTYLLLNIRIPIPDSTSLPAAFQSPSATDLPFPQE
ncbi:hypothetical protein LRP86_04055 [Pseudomonas brassicacearum]|nr:hypothetical protein DFO59_103554 [Pseudomonas fluorescens]UII17138.1 hypothetical protein LRP86_04055 [Pseudomonas brassicacearum]